jgi:hypothetical protein
MVQTSLVNKIVEASFNKAFNIVIALLFSVSTLADGGDDHTHAHEGDHGMQVLGIVIILVLAGGVIWFLSNKNKQK